MFICPSCLKETTTLIAGKEKLGCNNCVDRVKRGPKPDCHNRAGLRGEAKSITNGEKEHIMQRAMGPDGKTCVHRNNPNKRWNW